MSNANVGTSEGSRIKKAIVSVIIGAIVTIISIVLEGLPDLLNGYLDNSFAGVSSGLLLAARLRL